MAWIYRADQEVPSFSVAWYDRDNTLINFATGYTFELKLIAVDGTTIALTKTTGIAGAATSPNITVAWAVGELNIAVGAYRAHLTATTGGADRMFKPGDEPVITIVAAV